MHYLYIAIEYTILDCPLSQFVAAVLPNESYGAGLRTYTYFHIFGHGSLHILLKTSYFISLHSVMIAEPKPDFETFANKKLIEIWRVEVKNHICKGL